jgi:hypothetical protein
MARTELQDVQALLERVLPDPSGFAQRLLLQLMSLYGQSATRPASAVYSDADAFYTTDLAEDTAATETVIASDTPAADETPIDTSLLLAAAVGACECWGLQASCYVCQGRGSAGWTVPDPELYDEFVRPALARLTHRPADGHEQRSTVNVDEDSHHSRSAQGEST